MSRSARPRNRCPALTRPAVKPERRARRRRLRRAARPGRVPDGRISGCCSSRRRWRSSSPWRSAACRCASSSAACSALTSGPPLATSSVVQYLGLAVVLTRQASPGRGASELLGLELAMQRRGRLARGVEGDADRQQFFLERLVGRDREHVGDRHREPSWCREHARPRCPRQESRARAGRRRRRARTLRQAA